MGEFMIRKASFKMPIFIAIAHCPLLRGHSDTLTAAGRGSETDRVSESEGSHLKTTLKTSDIQATEPAAVLKIHWGRLGAEQRAHGAAF